MAVVSGSSGLEFYIGAVDHTPNLYSLNWTIGAESQPDADWVDTTSVVQAGLRTGSFTSTHRYSTGASGTDTVLSGIKNATTTIVPVAFVHGTTEGNAAYVQQVLATNFQTASGSIGDRHEVGFGGTSGGERFTGRVLNNGSQSTTGTSTGLQMGVLAEGYRLFSLLIVLSGTGTLDVVVQSDETGFSSPASDITHAQNTGSAGYELLTVDGAIADHDFRRSSYTIATGPFDFIHIIGQMQI